MDNKKFEEYLKSLEINEIYDMYQLGDEFTNEALEIMEKVALEKDGYKLRKEYENNSTQKIINSAPFKIFLVILLIFFTKLMEQIFKSMGLLFALILYSVGFGGYHLLKWIEDRDLSEYERKVKKLREKKGMTEIIIAIADKDFKKFSELLEMGRNIHKKTKGGWTTLMYAVRNDELEITKILLANGIDINEKTENGITAKVLAHQHRLEEMKILLEKY